MSEAHEEQHERLEREAADLERRSERLGDEIAGAKQDWEAKRHDESVAGAPAPESGLPPEANYTTSGDDPPDGDGAQEAREPWPDE
jgi:hypothetical protein